MFGFLRRWLAAPARAGQLDELRTKVAIANASSGVVGKKLDEQIAQDAGKMLDTYRSEPPRPILVYVVQLVNASGERRAIAAEVDHFGLGKGAVEKMMTAYQKSLREGEGLEVTEFKVFDPGDDAPITARNLK